MQMHIKQCKCIKIDSTIILILLSAMLSKNKKKRNEKKKIMTDAALFFSCKANLSVCACCQNVS